MACIEPLLGIILILFGVLGVFSPETMWQIEYGWKFKDAEPSEAALIINRVLGVVMVVFGVLALFL